MIEVLAAIALLALALAVALSALGRAAQNAQRAAALDTAVERAQSLLSEQGLAVPLKNETLSGKFEDGMGWSLKVHELPAPAMPATDAGTAPVLRQGGAVMAQAATVALYQLNVAVRYGADRTLRLSTERAQAAPTSQPSQP